MNGLVFDSLKGKNTVTQIVKTPQTTNAHGEHNDADTPAIDQLIVAFMIELRDNFWCEITRCATHGLQGASSRRCSEVNNLTYTEHGQTVNDLGEAEVGNFDGRRLLRG